MLFLVLTCFVGRLGTGLQLFFARLQIMASIESIVGDDSAPPVVPVFAATFSFLCNNHSQPRNSILFPKEHHLQFGKLDFGAEKTKITKRTNHWYFVHMTSARAVETILQGTKRNFLFLKDGRQAKAIKL
jgi:hypothetical protein